MRIRAQGPKTDAPPTVRMEFCPSDPERQNFVLSPRMFFDD